MTRRRPIPSTRAIRTLAAGVVLAASGIAFAAPSVDRERHRDRAALDTLEGAPIPAEALASLEDWTHRDVLDAADGRVVVLGYVSTSEPMSWMTISQLQRLARNHPDAIVAAIHPSEGWGGVWDKALGGEISIPMARDAGDAFKNALHADDASDLYVIDRAGALRYADIESKSLENAIERLSAETPEQAVANARIEAEGGTPTVASSDTGERADAKAENTIPPAMYRRAVWPQHMPEQYLGARHNFQGRELPHEVGDNEQWIMNRRDLDGKVLLIDFWATWCGPCLKAAPTLKKLQNKHEGKLEVVGIGGSEPKQDFVNFLKRTPSNYAQMFDARKTLSGAIGVRGIPHVLVVSTDGVVRFQGNPLFDRFEDVVDQIVAADPMVSPPETP